MLKKNLSLLLDFYNDKNDYIVGLHVNAGILSCKIYMPKVKHSELLFFQEAVSDSDFEEVSVDYKEFVKIIDNKIKAKYPFHLELQDGIMHIIQDAESSKIVGTVKYHIGSTHQVETFRKEDMIGKLVVNSDDFRHISIHDNIKTKLDLFPEFSNVTLYCNRNQLYLLSSDLTAIVVTAFKAEIEEEFYFSLSSVSVKNLLLFNKKEASVTLYKKDDSIILEAISIKDELPLIRYSKTCRIIDSSFYKNNAICSVINQISATKYTSAISLTKHEMMQLRDACTASKRDSEWDDKRSVLFQLNGNSILSNGGVIVSYECDNLRGNISGYNLYQVLNDATVEMKGKSKSEQYLGYYGTYGSFDILKNKNTYLINPKTI